MSKFSIKKSEVPAVISEESANAQIIELLSYYDIDIDKIGETSEKGAEGLETILNNLSRYIQRGKVEIDRDAAGKLVVKQHVANGQVLTYGEISAKSKIAMDRFGQNETYRRIYCMLGVLCGLGSDVIEKLGPSDLSIAEAIGAVFSNA